MKIRLLLTLAGLAIGYAVPAFTQEKDTVDPQIRQQLDALFKKFDEASNKADAAALAALFTQDAVEVAPEGPVYGRQALEKKYSDMFQKWHPTDHLNTIERVYMLGKDTCVINKWSAGGLKGYVTTINVREGDNWLFRIATVNLTPALAPISAATPSNTPDPQLREKLVAAIKKHTDALDKNDAAAVAACFTDDGVYVTPDGTISGREAIEKHYEGVFKQIQLSNNLAPVVMILLTS